MNRQTSSSGSNIGLDALIEGEGMRLGKGGYAAAADESDALKNSR